MAEQITRRANTVTSAQFEAPALLCTKKGAIARVSGVDRDLQQFSWYLNTNGYFMRYIGTGRGDRRQATLHAVILERCAGPRPGRAWLADHIDGDKLNNQRENLRWVTARQSSWNTPGRGNTGFKGVYRLRQYQAKFTASISVDGRSRYLGIFDSAEAAARAYDAVACQIGLGFARLNFPIEGFGG